MTVEENLRTNILADAGVQAVISNRLYARLPQNPDYPCVVFNRIATDRKYTMDQNPNSQWGKRGWVRFQYTAFSNDGATGLAQCIAAMDAIRASFKTFDLSKPGATTGGAPNFVISERAGDIGQTMPPTYTYMLDARHFFADQ